MYLNILPRHSDLFTGRETELKKIEKAFSETNFFYIEGITGIGKTSLMLKWANTIKDEYKDRILWLECQKDWTLDTILTEISDWLTVPGEKSLREDLQERPFNSKEKTLYIINHLDKSNYILFIDDFQNINQESAKIFIDTVKNYIKTSRIYVISRDPLPLPPFESIDVFRSRIKRLSQEDSLLFLEKFFTFHNFDEIPDREILKKIIRKAKGHPLFIKTYLSLFISGVSTIEDIIEESNIEKDMGKIVFEKVLQSLTEDEKRILEILSASRIPLPAETIKELSRIEKSWRNLSLLENKMLVEKVQTSRYLIQPLLKDYIWNDITESNRRILYKTLGEYFESKPEFYSEAFYPWINAGEPEKASEVLQKTMEKLYSLGYYQEFMEKMEILEKYIPLPDNIKIVKANILVAQGHYNEAIDILEDIKNKITDKDLLAKTYLSLADIYFYMSEFHNATGLYEDSLNMFRERGNREKISKITSILANIYKFTGEAEKASEHINENLSIAEKENMETVITYNLKAKAGIFLEKKDYEKVLEISEECIRVAEKIQSFRFSAWALTTRGTALWGLSKYDDALKCFETNLASGKKAGDRIITGSSSLNTGWIFYEKGDLEKACDFFKEGVENYKSIGNKTNVAVGEYYIGHVLEEKGKFSEAIDLYSRVLEQARELSHKKLELNAEIKIMMNRLKNKDLSPDLTEVLRIKNKIPEDFVKERININLLLSDIYFRENKQKARDEILEEALEIAEKACDFYGLAKTCYIMSKIPKKSIEEGKRLQRRAEENFEKLTLSEKRELKVFFNEINEKMEKKFLIKTGRKEFISGIEGVDTLRKKKDFEFFLDIPGKFAFEKDKGEINIFKKRILLSLLLFFIRNSDRRFSSEELYKEIWEWEYEEEARGTEVRKYISRLRNLIEPDKGSFKYILMREGQPGEKGKYYFNDRTNFCLIDFSKDGN